MTGGCSLRTERAMERGLGAEKEHLFDSASVFLKPLHERANRYILQTP